MEFQKKIVPKGSLKEILPCWDENTKESSERYLFLSYLALEFENYFIVLSSLKFLMAMLGFEVEVI